MLQDIHETCSIKLKEFCFIFLSFFKLDVIGLGIKLRDIQVKEASGWFVHVPTKLISFAAPPQTSSLQYLDARNTPLLDHSAPFVARALRISGSLAVLHLENAGLSGRPLMLLGKIGK